MPSRDVGTPYAPLAITGKTQAIAEVGGLFSSTEQTEDNNDDDDDYQISNLDAEGKHIIIYY